MATNKRTVVRCKIVGAVRVEVTDNAPDLRLPVNVKGRFQVRLVDATGEGIKVFESASFYKAMCRQSTEATELSKAFEVPVRRAA